MVTIGGLVWIGSRDRVTSDEMGGKRDEMVSMAPAEGNLNGIDYFLAI